MDDLNFLTRLVRGGLDFWVGFQSEKVKVAVLGLAGLGQSGEERLVGGQGVEIV